MTALLLVSCSLHAQKTLDDGVTELARQITTNATRQEKQRIAVLPFLELDGQPTVLGTFLSEELVTRLFPLGNFKIVERQLLDKVLGELRIQRSGVIDSATAKEIGRIAAVDAIVTGSITELGTYIAVNCRLIDTTTGEVFGAAQTKFAKDEDVNKILNVAMTSTRERPTGYQPGKVIATKDVGSLRVTLKSVLRITSTNKIRWMFQFENRESRRSISVALNAVGQDSEPDRRQRFASDPSLTRLRTSVIDDRGGSWKLDSTGLGGIGFVRAGVKGLYGKEAISPMDVARLLRLRDELGRETDDPSDGVMSRDDPGGYTIGNVGEPRFFPYLGNRFVSGTMTTIEPGQSTTVTMDFGNDSTSALTALVLQFNSEVVVGLSEGSSARSYSLHNITFERVNLSSP